MTNYQRRVESRAAFLFMLRDLLVGRKLTRGPSKWPERVYIHPSNMYHTDWCLLSFNFNAWYKGGKNIN